MDNNSCNTDSNGKLELKEVFSYAGAFIALLIGSGFATGQEVLQYFASYGFKGIAGAIVTLFLLSYVGISFIVAGYREKFENGNEIYFYICGDKLGKFYDYFSIFFIFLSLTVMIAGASATGTQHYGWNPYAGGILVSVLSIVTVIMGLNRIVDIIGNIGPAIVVIALVVSILSIIKYQEYIPQGVKLVEELVKDGEIKRASSHWLLAAGSYVGFCMLWLAAFLAQVGKNANSSKEGALGAFGGALGFSLAVILMTIALLSRIATVAGSQIPALMLAGGISPIFATIFSIMIFLGIYTTTVPLMWTVVSRFAEENTTRFRITTVVIGTVATFIGLVMNFDSLVNVVYVINGYVGLVLLFIMMFKSIKYKRI